MNKLDGKTMDLVEQNIAELKKLFPEAIIEGKIDFDRLRLLLGDEVDTGKEKYEFTWPGKSDCIRLAQQQSTGTLRPDKESSKDWDSTQNLYIEGDNLEVLRLLQKAYHKKIKMIYIDPPYNTGNDFIYKDVYKDNVKNYLSITKQTMKANPETSGRYHSDWLNMMYPRIRIAKSLLKDDGVIFISIDDHELISLRNIMNEIFGEENHIATLTVINNMKGRNDKANVATCHEYLTIYSKGDFESYGLPLSEEQLSQYKYMDDYDQPYALRDLRKRGRPDRREDRPNMFFPIYYNENTSQCSLERTNDSDIEILPKRGDGSDGRWRWGIDKVRDNLNILHPRYSTKKNRWDIDHRVYLNTNMESEHGDEEVDDDDQEYQRTSKTKSFWWGGEISTDVANREFKKLFVNLNPDYLKSPYFIEKLLHIATKADDLIADFFSGTSTTAQAVMQLNAESRGNRKFIMVQLPEPCNEDSEAYKAGFYNICEIGKERIRRAGEKIKEEYKDKEGIENLDTGFKVFKLDTSNLKAWDPDVEELEETLKGMVDPIKEDRTQEDMLYEIMLKYGIDLTMPLEEIQIKGKNAYSIGLGYMIVCLEDGLTLDVIEAIGAMKQSGREIARVVFRDSGFADDNVKTNAVQLLKKFGIEDFRTI